MKWINQILDRKSTDDRGELAKKVDRPEPDVGGVVKSSPDELKLEDISVEFKPMILKYHLPVFAPASEIIRINKECPEYLNARRAESEGSCDGCKSNTKRTKKEAGSKEDK